MNLKNVDDFDQLVKHKITFHDQQMKEDILWVIDLDQLWIVSTNIRTMWIRDAHTSYITLIFSWLTDERRYTWNITGTGS